MNSVSCERCSLFLFCFNSLKWLGIWCFNRFLLWMWEEEVMFATAVRFMAKKGKPKMKPIELKTPPEQTQTITRTIFDIVKEHGPLTISDTWQHLKVHISFSLHVFFNYLQCNCMKFCQKAFFFCLKLVIWIIYHLASVLLISYKTQKIDFSWRKGFELILRIKRAI